MRATRMAGAALALAIALLLGGCVEHVEDNLVTVAVQASFTAQVTGRAIVRWSDGKVTHTEEVDAGKKVWRSMVDQDHFVAAMTVRPIGKGSTASCAIEKGGQGTWEADSYTDEAPGPGVVAVCIVGGQADVSQPDRARTITVVPTTSSGPARYRVSTRNGAAFGDDLVGTRTEERRFTVVGPVNIVVVAQGSDEVVGCRISDAGGDLDVQSAMGPGAIATCHAFVTL